MSLTWVHIFESSVYANVIDWMLTDSVDPLAVCRQGVMQDIISGTGYSQNMIILVNTELLHADIGIFPCPAVDMGSELFVNLFLEIRNTPSLDDH